MSGEDERLHAVTLELPGEVEEIVVGQLRPAVNGEPPVPGVEPDDDVRGKLHAQVGDEVRCRDRPGAQDDVPDPGLDVRLHRLLVPDATSDLDRHLGVGFDDVVDDAGVLRLASEGTVEVDDVKTAGAGLDPA